MIRIEKEEAAGRLEELVEAALRGEDVIVEQRGISQVAIEPVGSTSEGCHSEQSEV
jgi:hypothetical protein